MQMSEISSPKLVQLFVNLLWVNSPKNWILKSIYFQETLFITMIVTQSEDEQQQKIRRSFTQQTIKSRSEDIYGLARDCVDEMRAEEDMSGDT